MSDAGSLSRLWISALVLAADQATKAAAERWLTPYEPREVLPFFDLTLAYNPGAAFSLLAGAGGWQRWLFAALAVVISLALIVWLRRLPLSERWTGSALALIVGGALGNLVDRLLHGEVIDFLDFHWAGYHWPAFNLADSAISVGAAILVVLGLFAPTRREPESESDRP